MIINPQSGSGGIKLLAHNIIATSATKATEVPVPTSLFALVVVSRFCCVAARGGENSPWNGANAILSADGNTLSVYGGGDNAEYWVFG